MVPGQLDSNESICLENGRSLAKHVTISVSDSRGSRPCRSVAVTVAVKLANRLTFYFQPDLSTFERGASDRAQCVHL